MQIINAGRKRKKRDTRMFQLPNQYGSYFGGNHFFFSSYSYSYFILRLRAQAFTISLMADLRQDRKGVLNIVADVFMEHFLGESGPLRPFSK